MLEVECVCLDASHVSAVRNRFGVELKVVNRWCSRFHQSDDEDESDRVGVAVRHDSCVGHTTSTSIELQLQKVQEAEETEGDSQEEMMKGDHHQTLLSTKLASPTHSQMLCESGK